MNVWTVWPDILKSRPLAGGRAAGVQ